MTDIDKVIEEARAEMLPFESWEQLKGESSAAFSAFCVFVIWVLTGIFARR